MPAFTFSEAGFMRNRSPFWQRFGTRLAGAVRQEGLMQFFQRALALQPSCLHHGQDALHEAAARLAPAAKIALAPQHHPPPQERSLRGRNGSTAWRAPAPAPSTAGVHTPRLPLPFSSRANRRTLPPCRYSATASVAVSIFLTSKPSSFARRRHCFANRSRTCSA